MVCPRRPRPVGHTLSSLSGTLSLGQAHPLYLDGLRGLPQPREERVPALLGGGLLRGDGGVQFAPDAVGEVSGLPPLPPRSARGPGAPAPGRPPAPAAPPRRRPGGRGLPAARRSRPGPGDRRSGPGPSARSTASLAAMASGTVSTTRRASPIAGGLQDGYGRGVAVDRGEARLPCAWSARVGVGLHDDEWLL